MCSVVLWIVSDLTTFFYIILVLLQIAFIQLSSKNRWRNKIV
ncbi:unnamed protein product [Acanthoscelides obtectus]|uniref:Uncharacterized protein n=1 Tax=Acanthoscelides obtectus TaxID=200917 RepID=A0A9P0KPX4_ACAOB|nr:unnamed protein product [Acanthoscelides obtectus]CAK1655927.1 hypothetical protein AOBTE_LOCUS19444 [Acanthoscelides obtectus]